MQTRRGLSYTQEEREEPHHAEFTYIICVDFCYILGEERNKKKGEGDRNKLYNVVKKRNKERGG